MESAWKPQCKPATESVGLERLRYRLALLQRNRNPFFRHILKPRIRPFGRVTLSDASGKFHDLSGKGPGVFVANDRMSVGKLQVFGGRLWLNHVRCLRCAI